MAVISLEHIMVQLIIEFPKKVADIGFDINQKHSIGSIKGAGNISI